MATYPPLTTTLTPPAACASEWTVETPTPSLTLVNFISGKVLYLVETCFPPGATVSDLAYSPGLICPYGYTTVADQTTVNTIFGLT